MTGIDDVYNFETKKINSKSTQGRKIWSFQFPASCTIPCKNLSFSVQPNVPIAFLFQYNKRINKRRISLHGLAKPVTKSPKIVHLNLFSYNDKPQLLSYFSKAFTMRSSNYSSMVASILSKKLLQNCTLSQCGVGQKMVRTLVIAACQALHLWSPATQCQDCGN